MNETIILTLLGGITGGAGLVWTFLTQVVYKDKTDRISELERRIDKQNEVIAWQTATIAKLVTAIKYSDSIKDSDSLHSLADQVLEELAERTARKPA